MVDPVGFRANPETAADNAFQAAGADATDPGLEQAARSEFEALRRALEQAGIAVEVHLPANAATPDAVFPNNWFSTLSDGTLVLYPMRAVSRRVERRPELVAWLSERYPQLVDLSAPEGKGRYLEGTGSLVIDEPARIVYASVSRRTDPGLVSAWAERFEYTPVVFAALDGDGREIYHTNVVMGIGRGWAVVCDEAIRSPVDRDRVLASLAETDHEIIGITLGQMHDFCGNVLELENEAGETFVVMSDRAYGSFRDEQIRALARHATPLHVDLTTIETHGGGSARCMLAELH